MITIARNAIYAATVITLWPSALSAQTFISESASDCPPLLTPTFIQAQTVARTPVNVPTNDPVVTSPAPVGFQMSAGRLKPQLERILRQHMGVQHIVWQVAEEHEWPSSYLLEGRSWPELVESLLAPYQLRLQLYANHSAVVSYIADASGRGDI